MTSVPTPEDARWEEFTAMLSEALHKHGCQHDHRLAEEIMMHMGGIDIRGSIEFFKDHGGSGNTSTRQCLGRFIA